MLDTDRSLRDAVFSGTVLLGNKVFALPSDAPVATSRIAEASEMQATLCSGLAQGTLRLELFSLSAIDQQVTRLEKSVAELDEQGMPDEQRLQRLETQHADIVEAIEAFNKPTVLKAFKGLIPTEEDINAAAALLKDPSVDPKLLKLISGKLQSHLDALEGATTFRELTQVRKRLYEKLQEARQLRDDAQMRKDKTQRELGATRALAGVGAIKDQWLQLVRKVEEYWQYCSSLLTAGMDSDKALIALEDLYHYLQAVQKAFERA
jgi:chromosome segregation ATPase